MRVDFEQIVCPKAGSATVPATSAPTPLPTPAMMANGSTSATTAKRARPRMRSISGNLTVSMLLPGAAGLSLFVFHVSFGISVSFSFSLSVIVDARPLDMDAVESMNMTMDEAMGMMGMDNMMNGDPANTSTLVIPSATVFYDVLRDFLQANVSVKQIQGPDSTASEFSEDGDLGTFLISRSKCFLWNRFCLCHPFVFMYLCK